MTKSVDAGRGYLVEIVDGTALGSRARVRTLRGAVEFVCTAVRRKSSAAASAAAVAAGLRAVDAL